MYLPAQLAVGVLEAGPQDVADVGHVEQHERDADQRVQDRHDLADVRLRGQVPVPWKWREKGRKEKNGTICRLM